MINILMRICWATMIGHWFVIYHYLLELNISRNVLLLPQQQSPKAFKLTPMCLPIDNSRAAPQCRQSPRQSPSTVITDLSALESPRSVGSYYETSSPQGNSSTSPRGTATNHKAKSEMCKNLLTKGYCRFGSECLFAHSEDERMKFSSVEEMYQHGLITNKADVGVYLNRPCCFWVRSGSWYVHCELWLALFRLMQIFFLPFLLLSCLQQPVQQPL